LLNGIIDFDYILAILHEIIMANKTENMDEIRKETKQKYTRKHQIYARIAHIFPNFVLKKLNLYYQALTALRDYDLADFQYNKMVCLEFLDYCFNNRKKLYLDLSLFKEEEDKNLILRHTRNILYVALSSHNPKMSEESLEYRRKYDAFSNNIEKARGGFVLKVENHEFTLPIKHFEEVIFFHKYGTDALPSYIRQSLANKDFIDAGAFVGDASLILNQLKPNKIYAFEPSKINYFLMQKTLKLNKLLNVIPVCSALSNKEGVSNMFYWGNASFLSAEGNEEVNMTTIDSFQEKNSLNVGLIKMDIEGSEFYAIQGAERTIKKFKPVLIISLYHGGKDFFEIPRILKDWMPTYTLKFLNLNRVSTVREKVLLAY
jgi:FkbM family methyltransferase